MGEVYLARDTRLNRQVALKVLPTELTARKERLQRFEQEAQAAAVLNHPNIAHMYEIGEREGVNFIAMEYVEGVTLREKIHRKQTELRKLLRYLQQVAEGLAKAHAAGIVHRDLKPDNVMTTRDGYAKILDFGLAKLMEAPGLDVAAVYAGFGEKDQAFAWLEKSFQDHSTRLGRTRYETGFETLRSDPRFADLLRRMGLKP